MIFEVAAPVLLCGAIRSHGESEVARFVAKQAREGRRLLYQTHIFGEVLMEALQGLAYIHEHCRVSDWDAFGAEPVRKETIWCAYRFLEALPPGTPSPTVGAEPDGHVTLEWHRSPRRTVSVSLSPDEDLHYSALLGPNKYYGTEAFFGEIPKGILNLIHRVQA